MSPRDELAAHAPETANETANKNANAAVSETTNESEPLVCVVIPTYRRPELLIRCLLGLAEQTVGAASVEIIVVDDGPCARTQALVNVLSSREVGLPAPAPALRYLRPEVGHGPATARNAGWRAARAPVVAFTDDDTIPLATWLAGGLAALAARPELPAVAGRVVVPIPEGVSPTDHMVVTRGLEQAEFVTANAFVRKSALEAVGGFDERFTRAWREDSDLQYRLEDQFGPLGRADDAVVLHPVREEPWGVSLRQQRHAFFEALLFSKHPRHYLARADTVPPWHYYAIVALALATLVLWLADIPGSAVVSGVIAFALIVRLALRRLRGTSHRLEHVLEMLVTSAAIPFLSIYWRLRGALHFRVWFL